ncbi:MAG: D-alanyl-D-alanine carboxypeptidase [Oscillospiraceae bacterium]|nr:D-alanyl-D-alanine carboxypeptidase [Oscillospiraceae bacterium]
MKKQRIVALFFILVWMLTLTPDAFAKDDFNVEARAALLLDVGSGEVLYEKNAHEHNYPASITKVMTALLTLEAVRDGRLSLDQEITASESAFEGLAADGSTANIKPGEVMSVENLLNCLLIVSANEAANILAEAVAGDVPSFVAQMNQRAGELGCNDTHFANPSGLHNGEHYTSAWDILTFTGEALKYDTFREIIARKAYDVPATNVSKSRALHTTNYLISNWRTRGYVYEYATGGKTGSTPEAGYCLVATAEKGTRGLISVVLGAERETLEDKTVLTKSFSETIRLFDHGFDDFKSMELVDTGEYIQEVPVELSSETNYIVIHPAEGIRRMVPAELEREMLERDIELFSESVDAPIAEGDVLGRMSISYEGVDYGTVDLVALNDVSASWLLTKEREVKEFLSQTWVKVAGAVAALLAIGLVALRVAAGSRPKRYAKKKAGYNYNGYRGRKRR